MQLRALFGVVILLFVASSILILRQLQIPNSGALPHARREHLPELCPPSWQNHCPKPTLPTRPGRKLSSSWWLEPNAEAFRRSHFTSVPLLDRVMLIPSEKLVICGVEKNAITQLIQVACALMDKPFNYFNCAHSPTSTAQLVSYLEDSEWNKVVVTRDPLERFVSGYRSKCLMGDNDGIVHREQALNLTRSDTSMLRVALALYEEFPLNPHWRPQHYFCGGTVGTHFHHYTHVPMENISLGLTAFLRSAVSTAAFGRAEKVIKPPTDSHRTNAREQTHLVHQETSRMIKSVYGCDYELFRTAAITIATPEKQPLQAERSLNATHELAAMAKCVAVNRSALMGSELMAIDPATANICKDWCTAKARRRQHTAEGWDVKCSWKACAQCQQCAISCVSCDLVPCGHCQEGCPYSTCTDKGPPDKPGALHRNLCRTGIDGVLNSGEFPTQCRPQHHLYPACLVAEALTNNEPPLFNSYHCEINVSSTQHVTALLCNMHRQQQHQQVAERQQPTPTKHTKGGGVVVLTFKVARTGSTFFTDVITQAIKSTNQMATQIWEPFSNRKCYHRLPGEVEEE